jgi:hypothetical protein
LFFAPTQGLAFKERSLMKLSISYRIIPLIFILSALGSIPFLLSKAALASVPPAAAVISTPQYIAGAGGDETVTDADFFPAVAYDASTQRFLVVWLSTRNASDPSDGLDVYGILLDRYGTPLSGEFRISDTNSVALNSLPTVAAGDGEFSVGWTRRGSPCAVLAQKVFDSSNAPDRLLVAGEKHYHSPNLTFNSKTGKYAAIFIAGDEYMAPALYGAETSDCGSNPASDSQPLAVQFSWQGDDLNVETPINLAKNASGAFRPRLTYSSDMDQYLAVWEDRRNAAGKVDFFQVAAQRVGHDWTLTGQNLMLTAGSLYTSADPSATWTPRPAVSAGRTNFLVSWFTRKAETTAVLWSVHASLLPLNGAAEPAFPVAQINFAQSHPENAPTGFLATAYAPKIDEYLVGLSSHMESFWGYFSIALVQRVSADGALLRLDGSVQNQPGVGYALDYENDDQIGIGLAADTARVYSADYFAVYSKHPLNHSEHDFDIWGARVFIPASNSRNLYVPAIYKNSPVVKCFSCTSFSTPEEFASTEVGSQVISKRGR